MHTPVLLGVWRLESTTSEGRTIHTRQTHLVVNDNQLFEVWPSKVYYSDASGPEREYELRWNGDDGQLEIRQPAGSSFFATLRIFGSELQVRRGSVRGRPPSSFFDESGKFEVYQRETNLKTVERLRRPPGRTHRETRTHLRLGSLRYDNGLGWWSGTIAYGGSDTVQVHVTASSDVSDATLDEAAELVERIPCEGLREYAATKLLELHNSTWRQDGPELDPAGFAARMRPTSFGVDQEGGVGVFFDDGDLFWGHSIIVSVDRNLRPIDAEIAG